MGTRLKAEDKLKKAEIKANERIEQTRAAKEIALNILNNPVFGLVGGYIFLEYVERRGWMGSISTTAAETGLIAVTTAKAIAPIAPQLAQGGAAIAKMLL